jgi:archaellum biogenesis protein FlaJ (TadC family)
MFVDTPLGNTYGWLLATTIFGGSILVLSKRRHEEIFAQYEAENSSQRKKRGKWALAYIIVSFVLLIVMVFTMQPVVND